MAQVRDLLAFVVLGAVAMGCSAKNASTVGPTTVTSTTVRPPVTTPGASNTTGGVTDTTGGPPGVSTSATTPGSHPSATTTPNTTGRTALGPPPTSSGKGAIAGHIYLSCVTGPPGTGPGIGSACQTRQGVPGVTVVVTSGETKVATTTSAADGSYRVDLLAGLYGIVETRDGQATRVQVDAGLIVVADFAVP